MTKLTAIYTTDISLADNDQLIDIKEEIIADLTEGNGESIDNHINTLLEIERELTLRENN